MEEIAFEKLTLEEILSLNNKELYDKYLKELSSLATTRLSKEIVLNMTGESILDIYEEITRSEETNRSQTIFSGDLVLLYGGIREAKAKSFITCDFSGGIIVPGNSYLSYRPILENISTNNTYVLKRTIKVECGYEYYLPRNIQEFEDLQRNIELEIDLNDGIDYSHLNRQVGGSLKLLPLKRKKKIKKR